RVLRIGDLAEVEVFELAATAFADCLLQPGITKIGKELEWGALIVFLPHEEQRSMRRKQQQGSRHFACAAGSQRTEAIPFRTIANLVVVLNADDVRGKWNMVSRRTAQRFPNLLRFAEVLVIPRSLSGQQCMQCVMEVVAPDCIQLITFGRRLNVA